MKGFKDTTRVQYSRGGQVTREKACGGMVKKAEGGAVRYVGRDTNRADPKAKTPSGKEIKTYLDKNETMVKAARAAAWAETDARVVDAMRGDIAKRGSKSVYAWAFPKENGKPVVPSRREMYGESDKAQAKADASGTPDFKVTRQKNRSDLTSDGAQFPKRGMKKMGPDVVVKKAEGGRVTDPVKNKTGGKNDPEYGDYAISKVEKSAKPVARAPATRGKSVPVAKSAPMIKAK